MLNDADAAGIAEARFGAAKGVAGVVIMLTFGTGIGSALLINGVLVPNTELGHLELDGHDAETRAAASVRDEHGMSYKKWAKRVNAYMQHVERLFTPGPVRRRRRRQQERRQVGAAARAADAGRSRPSCSTTPASSAPRSPPSSASASSARSARRHVAADRSRRSTIASTRALRTYWTRT